MKPVLTMFSRVDTGRRAERVARAYLVAQGYVIERANVRFPVGEIDLVARDGRTRCLVEVRSASSLRWGGAISSITDRKRHRLIRAARWFLQREPTAEEVRFDVVAIQWQPHGPPSVQLIKSAFDASDQR